jgi:hypothetical protein
LPSFLSAEISTSYKAGFHAGAVAQLDFGSLFVQPELLFSNVGIITKYFGESETISLSYIQLPVYAGYKTQVGLNLDVLLGAGPYIAYGILGADDEFKKINGERYMKPFDAGLSFMGGIQFNNAIQITLGYDLGLVDMIAWDHWKTTKDALNLSSIRNGNIKVSFAYLF